ncbi:septum formation protein Maf [Orientia chuto str. Dubai]|uniref:Nucleoside triphosphate pyrophosphatase n=1 Tax=Orientia chuto str. Dubai TaxID=1359168 RepID=A0A0F3MHU4_9RICK|nr:nucleoside triphosphate pyrophosphatase [Candidatus Orientia mediorientalis]KJV55330.1 septum formation protein Maf [Orientia chuto str. Dubai]
MDLMPIILASQSESRLKLLKAINIVPSQVISANIDETHLPAELPKNLALRLAIQKANTIAQSIENGYIIAADTVAAVGRRILPKAMTDLDVEYCLKMLSGRRHKVFTGVKVIKVKNNNIIAFNTRTVESIVKVKRLTSQEIAAYVITKQGLNKAGGHSMEGIWQCFVQFMRGSSSNIMGLPLFETRNMLLSLGFDCIRNI